MDVGRDRPRLAERLENHYGGGVAEQAAKFDRDALCTPLRQVEVGERRTDGVGVSLNSDATDVAVAEDRCDLAQLAVTVTGDVGLAEVEQNIGR